MSTVNLENFHKRAAAAEEEIAFLKKEIEFLRQNITTNNSKINSISEDEYTKLEQENIKLKHRVAILKRVCTIKLIPLKLNEQNQKAKQKQQRIMPLVYMIHYIIYLRKQFQLHIQMFVNLQ